MKKIILYIIQCFFHQSAQWQIQTFGLPENFFWPFGPHFGKKMGGGRGGGSLPWIRHCCNPTTIHYTLNICRQVIEHIGSL